MNLGGNWGKAVPRGFGGETVREKCPAQQGSFRRSLTSAVPLSPTPVRMGTGGLPSHLTVELTRSVDINDGGSSLGESSHGSRSRAESDLTAPLFQEATF